MILSFDIATLILAFIVMGSITAYYKDNPIFRIAEALIISITVAQLIGIDAISFYSRVIIPLISGNYMMLLPFLIGLGYLTFFHRKLLPIYRLIVIAYLAATIGAAQAAYLASIWTMTVQYGLGAAQSITGLIQAAIIFLTLFYFIFMRVTDKPLAPLRKIGFWIIITGIAFELGSMWNRYANNLIGWLMRAATGYGLYLGAIILLVIIVDVTAGWRKMLGLKPKATS